MAASRSKLSYRPEIDGLRAIAVISVILYHAKFTFSEMDLFAGGYIGVDIFFVISGYLITRIIIEELRATGKFSFLNFYERRARRILPMLLVLIGVSLPLAWLQLFPSALKEFAWSVIASIFFASNFFFYFTTTVYGAESALLKPFLHTWSLGVEEQFYLLFPVVAILVFRFLRGHFFFVTFGLLLLSLGFAQYVGYQDQELNFFLPFSRFWELAAGSLLAVMELRRGGVSSERWVKALPTIGLLMVFLSFLFFGAKTPHPSLLTLLPVVGAAFVVGFSGPFEPVGRFLSLKPMVKIGLVSYSAYLWHFIIFAFYRNSFVESSVLVKIGLIVLTLFLSWLSYNFVEQVFRSQTKVPPRLFWWCSVGLTALAVVFCFVVGKGVVEQKSGSFEAHLLDYGHFRQQMIDFETGVDYSPRLDNRINVLIVGNSYAEDLMKILKNSYINRKYNLNLAGIPRDRDINYQVRCFEKFLVSRVTTCEGRWGRVEEFAPNITEQFKNADVIFLASRWHVFKDVETMPNVLLKLVEEKRTAVVIAESPMSKVFGVKDLNRFEKFLFFHKRLPTSEELAELERKYYEDHIVLGERNKILEEMVEKMNHPMVHFARRSDFMCDHLKKRCFFYFEESKAKTLVDYGHVTDEGALELAKRVDRIRWLDNVIESHRRLDR